MFATPLVTIICSYPRIRSFNLVVPNLAAAHTASTHNSDFGGITVCRATRISSCLSDSLTVNKSFSMTELANLTFSRSIALVYRVLGCIQISLSGVLHYIWKSRGPAHSDLYEKS